MGDVKPGRNLTLIAALSATGACWSTDPLSVTSNESGSHLLHHVLVGSQGQIVCVLADRTQGCFPRNAQLIVEGVDFPGAVSVDWAGDSEVQVVVGSGRITRAARTSPDGRVRIVVRGDPA